MTDIEKLKNNELFIKALRSAKSILPNSRFYCVDVDLLDVGMVYLAAPNLSDDVCERIGSQALPGYSQEEADNLDLPLCIGALPQSCLDNLLDVTDMEV